MATPVASIDVSEPMFQPLPMASSAGCDCHFTSMLSRVAAGTHVSALAIDTMDLIGWFKARRQINVNLIANRKSGRSGGSGGKSKSSSTGTMDTTTRRPAGTGWYGRLDKWHGMHGRYAARTLLGGTPVAHPEEMKRV